ncbi:MAG: molybdenum cofactor biosynthesis protein MoaE [Rhodospirillaceae bacterium]|nr:molybdenum cofactor biosynthesis protein MoaE [Rhodospirillaceae bacterium]
MIRVQQADFDAGAEITALSRGNHEVGGVCSFVGLVREGGDKETGVDTIAAMTLEYYPGMTEKQLTDIEAEARKRWPLQDSLIIHRYGRLVPGDQIVLVITASAHRKAAFEACEFLMDWLKTQAPFWKSEETADGKNWVKAKESDDEAAEKWRR